MADTGLLFIYGETGPNLSEAEFNGKSPSAPPRSN